MRNALITVLILGTPRAALACPVCFGQNDSPMANAINAGVIAMLIVVVGVLAGFASFIVYLNRRARLVSDANSPTRAGDFVPSGPAESGRHILSGSDPQEGTLQC
jgi:hypothetical protein